MRLGPNFWNAFMYGASAGIAGTVALFTLSHRSIVTRVEDLVKDLSEPSGGDQSGPDCFVPSGDSHSEALRTLIDSGREYSDRLSQFNAAWKDYLACKNQRRASVATTTCASQEQLSDALKTDRDKALKAYIDDLKSHNELGPMTEIFLHAIEQFGALADSHKECRSQKSAGHSDCEAIREVSREIVSDNISPAHDELSKSLISSNLPTFRMGFLSLFYNSDRWQHNIIGGRPLKSDRNSVDY